MSPPILFLVGLFLAVAIAGGVVGASLIDAASQAQTRLAAARENLESLLRTQFGQDAALRGYIASGDRAFLEFQTSPAESFDARADRLNAELLNVHLADVRAEVQRLRGLHAAWEHDVAAPLLRDPKRPDALRLETRGRDLTEAMRRQVTRIRDRLVDADGVVGRELRWRINATVTVSVGITAIFAITALALGLSRAQALQALGREQSLFSALQQTLRVDGVVPPRTAIGFRYTSATREALVGGDLIDTWLAAPDAGWFMIADVSGKGIEAARHSAFAQYAIRTLSAQAAGPAEVVERFNRLFLSTFADPGIFVVLFVAAFDARGGHLRYASAGHSTAFVVRSGGGIEQLEPTGSIVGLDAEQTFSERRIDVATGDTIVVATDGLTESRDDAGQMLGDDGVMLLLRDAAGGPQAICDRLAAEVQRRSRGEVSDDLAILVLRILPADVRATATTFSTLNS